MRYIRAVDAALRYRSGEQIQKGDHVLFHGNPASVELVAFDPNQSNTHGTFRNLEVAY
jgi:hypothetical protein